MSRSSSPGLRHCDGGRNPTVHGGGSPNVEREVAQRQTGRDCSCGRPNDCWAAMYAGKITSSCSMRRVVGDQHLTDRGEVRQQDRQGRLHLVQQRRNLLRDAGSRLQDRRGTAGRCCASCVGDAGQAARPGPDRVAGLRPANPAAAQCHRSGPGVWSETPLRSPVSFDAESSSDWKSRPGAVERLERLVEQVARSCPSGCCPTSLLTWSSIGPTACGIVGCPSPGSPNRPPGTARTSVRGTQIDVLLADRGDAAHLRLQVGGNLRRGVQRQRRLRAVLGQLDRRSPCRSAHRGRSRWRTGTARRGGQFQLHGDAPDPSRVGTCM